MDDQELQRLMQQALEEIRTLGAVSAETAKKIDEAGDSMADFKKTAMALGAQFTRTMTNLVTTVGAGNTEFTASQVLYQKWARPYRSWVRPW